MDFCEFRLQDHELLERHFRADGNRLCEYSFASQFCWRAYNRSVWAIVDGMVVVRFEVGGHYRFTCPVGAGDRRTVVGRLLEWLAAAGSPAAIDFVPDSRICHEMPDGLTALPDPANYDYIYLREELAKLAGKKFAHKRNHIAALSREHDWEVRPVDAGARGGHLLDYLDRWAADRCGSQDGAVNELEIAAAREALTHAGRLGLQTFELVVDGTTQGLSVVEMTHPDMATVHFEKASADIRGAYQAICNGVAALLPSNIVYINREQDMGVEGLRKTKKSWNPVGTEKCWVIRPAGHASAPRTGLDGVQTC